MLVRTNKRIAGFPPPGVVGEVDDERALAALARGDVEDMSSLSARLGRKPEDVTGGEESGAATPSAPASFPAPDPSGGPDAVEAVVHSPTTPGGKAKVKEPPAKSA